MEKGKNDWEILGEVREIKPEIAFGADSTVFPLTKDGEITSVAKLYDQFTLKTIMSPENFEEVLRQYYADTERAAQILEENSNPLEQSIEINGEVFSLQYKVVSQGPLILDKNDGKLKASVGQKFIQGVNLSFFKKIKFTVDLRKGQEPTEAQQLFTNNPELCTKLSREIEKIFPYLSRRLDVSFGYTSTNVKPFVDNEEKKIIIVITDLCSSLREYYEESPRFFE